MKNNWVSLLALVLSIIALIITFLRIDITISNDTFIGIIASFIGVCATFIVGTQIYNSIEARRLMNDIRDRQNKLDTDIKEAYKTIGNIDAKIENFNLLKAEFDDKIKSAESKFNDLYSFAAFIQGFTIFEEKPMEAYKNFIDALYWGLGSIRHSAIEPSLNCMENIVEELEQKFIKNSIVDDWDIQIDKIPISLNNLKKHPRYTEISKRVEYIENRRTELVKKIENGNTGN